MADVVPSQSTFEFALKQRDYREYQLRAIQLITEGDFTEAQKVLERLLALFPKDPRRI